MPATVAVGQPTSAVDVPPSGAQSSSLDADAIPLGDIPEATPASTRQGPVLRISEIDAREVPPATGAAPSPTGVAPSPTGVAPSATATHGGAAEPFEDEVKIIRIS